MGHISRRLTAIVALGLVLAGCSGAGAPTWTYPPGGSPAAGAAPASANPSASTQPITPGPDVAAAVSSIDIKAFDLGFDPSSITVAGAATYDVTFQNTGSTFHDLTFSDGTKLGADPGVTATGKVTVPAAGLTFLCSVPGHADAGMRGTIGVATTAAASTEPGAGSSATTGATASVSAPTADPNAAPYVLRDATAPAVLPGTVHDIDLPIIEKDITVAKGFVVRAWTFGGAVPGPTIRVHLGDTVRINLKNEGAMAHSIDFHASQTAWNDQMVDIAPGGTATYTFKADYAGVWMYHCGTAPALEHIANGMFGMVIVEPKGGLPKVDQEFAFVQSEWYLGAQGEPADYAKASAAAPAPDFVVFNGIANQYKDNPIQVTTKGRVRVFVLDAGPSIDSSYHVVGTLFDEVTKEGVVALKRGNAGGWGAQAIDLSPAQGGIVEFSPAEDGLYPFVTHAFNFVGRGALGLFKAGDGDPKN
ncbi:MAG: multicopper oxidase domain-containing protein [Chloroflexi bacterium]|nr:multicopper oxidase domain-containing protein [Chloroflexota bacterium]